MPLHPPAPTEFPAVVEAWAQTVRSVIDLGRTLRPGDAERPTDCPGWTVQDQVAHVTLLGMAHPTTVTLARRLTEIAPAGLNRVFFSDAGATAVIQPGGSIKDSEVIAAADAAGLAMVFTGVRHFRH